MTNRIDAIAEYAQKKNAKIEAEKNAEEMRRQKDVERVLECAPRIKELIATANACIDAGIEIDACHAPHAWQSEDTWENGTFCTNGISHKIGFVWWRGRKTIITHMGAEAGGACGSVDMLTDGNSVQYGSDWLMGRFLDNFDAFEAAFYNYVDKKIKSV